MKSAYELAMEKLEKETPVTKVTDEMKAELAELDNFYQSKLAGREVFLGGKIADSLDEGAAEVIEEVHEERACTSNRRRCSSRAKRSVMPAI